MRQIIGDDIRAEIVNQDHIQGLGQKMKASEIAKAEHQQRDIQNQHRRADLPARVVIQNDGRAGNAAGRNMRRFQKQRDIGCKDYAADGQNGVRPEHLSPMDCAGALHYIRHKQQTAKLRAFVARQTQVGA